MKKLILLILAALTILSGCSASTSGENFLSFFAMDTVMTVRAYGADDDALSSLQEIAMELQSRLSVTDPDSEIARLNAQGSAVVSDSTAALLGRALALCADTGGSLDITVYPVVRAWGFTTGEHRIPSAGELAALLENVDFRRVSLEGDTAILEPGTEIDLGSVAKGLAGDLMASSLRDSGVSCALLDLGGNIQAVGSKPDGSPWRVGVRDPEGSGILAILDVSDAAVITSGGYERCFTGDDGTVYWHIMDPFTGSPARSGLLSVTVTGSEGLLCDALSTALFVMGEERAVEYWREKGGFDMILVTEDGRVLYTAPLAGRLAPQEDKYSYMVVDYAEN